MFKTCFVLPYSANLLPVGFHVIEDSTSSYKNLFSSLWKTFQHTRNHYQEASPGRRNRLPGNMDRHPGALGLCGYLCSGGECYSGLHYRRAAERITFRPGIPFTGGALAWCTGSHNHHCDNGAFYNGIGGKWSLSGWCLGE